MAIAHGQAVFTADYYLTNPEAYVGKEVTLSVASLNPRNEQRADGLRQLEAQTLNQRSLGGTIKILAPANVATALIQQCGTNRTVKTSSRTTMIHGVFSQDETGAHGYYLLVTH